MYRWSENKQLKSKFKLLKSLIKGVESVKCKLQRVVVEIGEVAMRARCRNREGKYTRTMPRTFGNRFKLLNL